MWVTRGAMYTISENAKQFCTIELNLFLPGTLLCVVRRSEIWNLTKYCGRNDNMRVSALILWWWWLHHDVCPFRRQFFGFNMKHERSICTIYFMVGFIMTYVQKYFFRKPRPHFYDKKDISCVKALIKWKGWREGTPLPLDLRKKSFEYFRLVENLYDKYQTTRSFAFRWAIA